MSRKKIIKLGATYKDRITGVEGVAIGHVKYITGCDQTLIQPRLDDLTKPVDSYWFDDQRIEKIAGEVIILDNSETPGFDKEAPKR